MDLQRLFDLADPRVRKIWNQVDTQLSKFLEHEKIGLTNRNLETLNDKFENYTGHGLAQLTGEKEPYSRQDISQGYSVTSSPDKWTDATDISEEMLRFNRWDQINAGVRAVGNALNARINLQAAKILYLGFGTTFSTGGDGSALFADAHTMIDGSTQDNNLGTLPLSYDNLKTACQLLDRFTDDKGIQLIPCRKLRLVVARENKERAEEVLRSIGNPDSANRVNNVFNNGEGYIDLVVSNWIPAGYSKYWFVMDMERAKDMAFMNWGWRPKFDDDKVINNGTKVYTGSTMFQPIFSSWQWCAGSAATS